MSNEDDLIGKPIDDVPERDPDSYCNARRTEKRGSESVFVGYCSRTSGWGTDTDHGRCKTHGGNGGAPSGEDNGAYKHGLYSEDLNEDDIERLEALDDVEDLDKLEHLVDFEMVRFLRAEGLLEAPSLDPQYICRICGWELPSPEIGICPNCEEPIEDSIESYRELHLNDGPLAQRAKTIAHLVDTKSKVKHRRDKIEKGEKIRSEHSGSIDGERTLGDEEKEMALEFLKKRHERAAEASRDE